MVKNKAIISIVGTIFIIAAAASFAVAQTTTGNSSDQVKKMVSINQAGKAQLAGNVASIQSSAITVNSWGGVWTVNITADTNIVRRFEGKSNLSEFTAGDDVLITGTANQGAAWTVDAKMIRNMSIQTRNANFSGTISNLSGRSFSFATKARGNINVTVNPDAKIVVNGKSGSVSDLANGMTGSVSGVWDRKQSTVLASKVAMRTPKTQTVSPTSTSTQR